MANTPKTLGLITARGGSKGIPRKNIKYLAGKPLIAWTIEAALASQALDAVVVTTDDDEIATVAQRYGAAVPFLRPPELARDDTPSIDPVLHALDRLPEFHAIVLLQPTSPLRTALDIDTCARLAFDGGLHSVVSVCVPPKHPYWMYRVDSAGRMHPLIEAPLVTRRQDLPPVYAVNGAVYFARAEWLRRTRRFVTDETLAYVMDTKRSVDVDSDIDWALAEHLLAGRTRPDVSSDGHPPPATQECPRNITGDVHG